MQVAHIEASKVKVGDTLVFLYSSFRVLRIHDYTTFTDICPGYTARWAECDRGFCMTLVDGQLVEVAQ